MASLARATHGELLARAAGGDQAAWDVLVDRFSPLVWAIARSARLDEATAKDVSQTVWLKLVENCHRIDDPERLPGWLATTCRREAIRVKKARERMVVTGFELDLADESPSLETILVEDEETGRVLEAFATLGAECRELLRLLLVEPALSYQQISEILGRPVGALGPTRARCIRRLQAALSSSINRAGEGSPD